METYKDAPEAFHIELRPSAIFERKDDVHEEYQMLVLGTRTQRLSLIGGKAVVPDVVQKIQEFYQANKDLMWNLLERCTGYGRIGLTDLFDTLEVKISLASEIYSESGMVPQGELKKRLVAANPQGLDAEHMDFYNKLRGEELKENRPERALASLEAYGLFFEKLPVGNRLFVVPVYIGIFGGEKKDFIDGVQAVSDKRTEDVEFARWIAMGNLYTQSGEERMEEREIIVDTIPMKAHRSLSWAAKERYKIYEGEKAADKRPTVEQLEKKLTKKILGISKPEDK